MRSAVEEHIRKAVFLRQVDVHFSGKASYLSVNRSPGYRRRVAVEFGTDSLNVTLEKLIGSLPPDTGPREEPSQSPAKAIDTSRVRLKRQYRIP
jgi:hypothetical protein